MVSERRGRAHRRARARALMAAGCVAVAGVGCDAGLGARGLPVADGAVAEAGQGGAAGASPGTGGAGTGGIDGVAGQGGRGGQAGSGAAGARGTGGAGGAGGRGGSGGGPAIGEAVRWIWTAACPDGHDPTDPVDYGRCAVRQALAERGATFPVTVAVAGDAVATGAPAELTAQLDQRAESFVVATAGGTVWSLGRDAVGAMYGALEIAERIRLGNTTFPAVASALRGAPATSFRAANLFLTLKESTEPSWWYLDESFWRDYLDLLAHARLNVLDLHAAFDAETTQFPNGLLYLATSATFPEVGAPREDRERNLRMLNRIIQLGQARGISIALMTYQASTSLDVYTPGPLDAGDRLDDLATHVREVAADLARRAPGLSRLGFRIGESGHPAQFYGDTFVRGVREAGSAATFYTRTWQSTKADIQALAQVTGPELLLEIKFNAEHLGPPYAIAGGAFAQYMPIYLSYSYESYLSPPYPWGVVFQVRAAGTHRIFRQASYARARRAVASLALSPIVRGFSLEPPHAFASQRPDYHARAEDDVSPWTFARDDLFYLLWGRLSYDGATPEATFRDILAYEAGTPALWDALQAASEVVPWINMGHSCGPDSREFAPEMELGGNVAQWAGLVLAPPLPAGQSVPTCDYSYFGQVPSGPFDSFAVASPADAATDLLAGAPTSRLSPRDVAGLVASAADRARSAAAPVLAAVSADGQDALARPGVLARDIARECTATADLGDYFAHKLRAATALAVFRRTGATPWLGAASSEIVSSSAAWRALAANTAYMRPFPERLRMKLLGYDPFHWSSEIAALASDDAALAAAEAQVAAANIAPPPTDLPPVPGTWLTSTRGPGPGPVDIAVSPRLASASAWTVSARFASPPDPSAKVRILWKRFESTVDWTAAAATLASDGTYQATITGGGAGALFAVELSTSAGAWRYPDPSVATPYVWLSP